VTSLTKKTLPSRDWQTPAAPGQEAFLTPYLTTVRAGTRGNSGFKSVKKYRILSRKRWKALQITTKNLVQAFGSKMPGVRVSPLGPRRSLLRLFYKSQSALTPLLILSKSQPLRWVVIWYRRFAAFFNFIEISVLTVLCRNPLKRNGFKGFLF